MLINKESPSWRAGKITKAQRFKEGFFLPRQMSSDRQDTLISIFYIPRTKDELENMSEAELRRELRPFFDRRISEFSVDYQTKTRSGYPAAVVLGKLPREHSFTAFIFPQKDHSVVLSLELPKRYEKVDDIHFLLMTESFRCYNTTPALKGGDRK